MKKLIGYGFFSQFVVSLVLVPLVAWKEPKGLFFVMSSLIISGRVVFKDTLNRLQAIGPVYWITRDYVPSTAPLVGLGFMRETQAPWRTGRGLQVKALSKTFQIGVCKRQHYKNPLEGELSVVGGRFMETPPEEIGEW